MKKFTLLALVLCLAIGAWAQKSAQIKPGYEKLYAPSPEMAAYDLHKTAPMVQADQVPEMPANRDVDVVSVIEIGTSANAYSYSYGGGQKQLVWADPNLNVVTNFHRMGGDLDPTGYSGDLGYDISFDGGLNWTNMVEVYVAANNQGGTYYTDAARYPNHGIFNPMGNTDINNAWVTYCAPTLDLTNGGSWGGYGLGRANLGTPTDTIRHLETTVPPFYLYIPDAFDISPLGYVVVADPAIDWSVTVYQGQFVITRGEWDEDISDFIWTKDLLDVPLYGDEFPANAKVAFAPDGMTVWLAIIGDNEGVTPLVDSSLYPIFYKSEDAGETWGDPIAVQLDGPNGIPEILEYLTDEQIDTIFVAPAPARDEIGFQTAFDCDLAVDQNGNPHLAVMIALSYGGYSIPVIENQYAAFDIFSPDGGETWRGVDCGRSRFLRGRFPDDTYTEDNRIQIASTISGDKMFVAWLNTVLETATDNSRPDIFCRGIDVNYGEPFLYTVNEDGDPDANYVTYFSDAMWESYFFGMSRYVLEDGNGNYTIPMTYQQMQVPLDPGLPVQYMYIPDFVYNEADFQVVGLGAEKEKSPITSVSQNFPNPFNSTSTVYVNVEKATNLSMTVTNILGQQVQEVNMGNVASGRHQFVIDATDLTSGIYFYTVYAGKESVTKKMIIE